MQHQRSLLSSSNPKFIVDLVTVKGMTKNLQQANEAFANAIASGKGPGQDSKVLQQAPNFPGGQVVPPQRPNAMQSTQGSPQPIQAHQLPSQPTRPASSQAHLQLPPQIPQHALPSPSIQHAPTPAQLPHIAPTPTPVPTQLTPPSKKSQISQITDKGAPVSTPPAAASTPANAPTPTATMSSPQTPKSPRTKPPKAKAPVKRKATGPKTPIQSATTPSAQPNEQRPVTPGAAAAPAVGPSTEVGFKRPREEDVPVASTSAASLASSEPSAKKIKTEWDGPPIDSIVAKDQKAADAMKSDEAAVKFYEEMTEMLKFAAETDDGTDHMRDISDTLGEILKGYGAPADGSDANLLSGSLNIADMGPSGSSTSNGPVVDEFEFFDFSLYTNLEEDSGSKVGTPDLQPSSTNPSPGSGSETEAAGHASGSGPDVAKIAEAKSEDTRDDLRLGIWSEIDGGESQYFQPAPEWKWEGTMPTSNQSWAMFAS